MKCGFEIEGRVIECSVAELLGALNRQTADIFFSVFDDDLIDPGLNGLRAAAEGYRATGLCLQAERTKFQRVRHRHSVEVIRRDQIAQGRETLAQAGFEVGQIGDGAFSPLAGDNRLNRSVPAP